MVKSQSWVTESQSCSSFWVLEETFWCIYFSTGKWDVCIQPENMWTQKCMTDLVPSVMPAHGITVNQNSLKKKHIFFMAKNYNILQHFVEIYIVCNSFYFGYGSWNTYTKTKCIYRKQNFEWSWMWGFWMKMGFFLISSMTIAYNRFFLSD